MDVLDFPEPGSRVVDLGPERRGRAVWVDGHVIPNLHAHDRGEMVEFVLDERFSFEFPREWSKLVAAAMAQAMAIGAGYPHLGAKSKDRPFAPEVKFIGEWPA